MPRSYSWNEGALKLLKVEFSDNHLLDLTQILDLSLVDHFKEYKVLKWRKRQMEINSKELNVEYLSNH